MGYWLEVKVWLSGLGFLFWTSCRLAVWPGHFLSLCFSLLICQMGVLALWLVRLALCLQCAVRRSDELCCRNARYLANILCFSLICCCLLLEVDKYLLVHSSNSSRCKLGQVVSPFFLRQNPHWLFLDCATNSGSVNINVWLLVLGTGSNDSSFISAFTNQSVTNCGCLITEGTSPR